MTCNINRQQLKILTRQFNTKIGRRVYRCIFRWLLESSCTFEEITAFSHSKVSQRLKHFSIPLSKAHNHIFKLIKNSKVTRWDDKVQNITDFTDSLVLIHFQLNFHTSPDGFFQSVPKEMVPSDYGGTGPSVETLNGEQYLLSVK